MTTKNAAVNPLYIIGKPQSRGVTKYIRAYGPSRLQFGTPEQAMKFPTREAAAAEIVKVLAMYKAATNPRLLSFVAGIEPVELAYALRWHPMEVERQYEQRVGRFQRKIANRLLGRRVF